MTQGPPAAPLREPIEDDLRLARLHLRMGQLTLALAELEDLLGRDALGPRGLALLAEARWRMNDLRAAATAAEAHLEAGGKDVMAICIAAEAAAVDGRPADARSLMDRLPHADAATLDALFAGMPRRAPWPAASADRTDIDDIRRAAEVRPDVPGAAGDLQAVPSRAVPGPREVLEASGAWADIAAQVAGDDAARGGRPARERRRKAQLDPRAELELARDELAGKPERALLRLALALRADPTIAPAVLEAIALRREPLAALLRGDAQRMLGRHLEAEAAFDAAAESLES